MSTHFSHYIHCIHGTLNWHAHTLHNAHSVHTVDTNCTQTQTAYSEPTTHTTNTTHTVPTDHPTHFTYTVHTTNTVQIAPTTRPESTIYYKYTVQRFLKQYYQVQPVLLCTILYHLVVQNILQHLTICIALNRREYFSTKLENREQTNRPKLLYNLLCNLYNLIRNVLLSPERAPKSPAPQLVS